MISMVPRPAAEGGGRVVGGGGGGKPLSSGEELSQIVGEIAFVNNEAFDAGMILRLSTAIDSAVTDNERPAKVHDLAQLVKKVYERRCDSQLQPAIMVLMFSVKNACINKWFQRSDADALFMFYNEMLRCFTSKESMGMDVNIALPLVTQVTSRFYPHLRVDHVIFSMEAKPGYNVLVTDFYIQRTLENISDQRIRLFVSQVDNLEASSCIINPSEVNFLINGLGVVGRNKLSPDSGPQLPTDVTHLLKVGTNLLQAIGMFTGSYLIAIAVMVPASTPDASLLKEYTTPAVSTVSSDDEIIEGPSRISLNCPISHQRIRTPVKGKNCKHIKCFDYNNFMDINSRRPTWRCPHCAQPTIWTDLRIDQNMLKVLTEVGHDVSNVVFSTDGSWKPCVVKDTDSVVDKGTGLENLNEKKIQDPCTNSPGLEALDRKPSKEIFDRLVHTQIHSGTSYVHPSAETSQGTHEEMARDIWLRATSPNYASNSCVVPAVSLAARTVSQPISTYSSGNMISMPTDAVAIMPTGQLLDAQGVYQPTLNPLQSISPGIEVPAEESSVHHPRMVGNAITESTRSSIPRNVTRTPSAVQALPAQGQQQSTFFRARSSLNANSTVGNGSASPSSVTVNPGIGSVGMEQHQLIRQQTALLGGSEVSSSPVPVRSNLQERQHHPNQPHQSVVGLPAMNQAGSRSTLDQQRIGFALAQVRSFQGQQSMQYQPNVRVPQTTIHSGTGAQQVPTYRPLLVHQGLPATSGTSLAWRSTINQQNIFRQNDMTNATPASNHMTQSTRPPGLPIPRSVDNSRPSIDQQWNSPTTSVPMPGTVAPDMAYEQDLRPAKRMRGSVSLSSVHDRINPGLVSHYPMQQQHALQGQRIPSPGASQLPTVIANNLMSQTSESHARTGNPAG